MIMCKNQIIDGGISSGLYILLPGKAFIIKDKGEALPLKTGSIRKFLFPILIK